MFELSEARCTELTEQWAARIVNRGWTTAAVFLLEAHKPLAGIGAHALLGLRPLIDSVLQINVEELAAFVRQPDNIERLVLRIEELDRERRERMDK